MLRNFRPIISQVEAMKRKVNLNEITGKEPLKVKTTIQPSLLEFPEEINKTSPFEIEVEISKRATGYQLKGTIKGKVELTCSRCLKKFSYEINSEFSYRLMPTSEIAGGEIKSSDLDIKFSDESIVDLAEVVQEQVLLNLPVKPICSEECKEVRYIEWEEEEDRGKTWKKLKALHDKLKSKE
jgi:uncharacterized protein